MNIRNSQPHDLCMLVLELLLFAIYARRDISRNKDVFIVWGGG